MSDSPKQCGPSSAPSTSKQPPTRPLKQFTVLNTESYGPKQPKPATVNDRPRNLLPTSHRTHAANLKPDPDDPRNVLSRSTEHNPAPSSVTLRVPHTSRRIVDTAGVEGGSQTFHRRPCIEHRQHSNSKSTVEYQPALQGDRQEPLAGDATTFVDPPRPQIFAGLPMAAPVYRGRIAPSQSPATSETQNSPSSTKDKRHNELYDQSLAVHPSGISQIVVKHEIDSRSSTPRNDASGMEQAPVILCASDYHGATPPAHRNHWQDPLPFRAHSPVHPVFIPDYDTLEERYFRLLRQDETLPTPKRVETVETTLISNESGVDESHIPLSLSRSLRWPGAKRPQSPTPQRGGEVATLKQNSGDHEPIHHIRVIDSPVPNQLKSPWSENGPSNPALTTPNWSRRRKQIRVPRQDTAAPETSTPPETNYVTKQRQRAPSLRAGSVEKSSMPTDPPHTTKKPASSTGSSSSSEDRQEKKQSRTSATSSSHMDFYGSTSFDWEAPYLSSIPTSLLLNNQYQHSVTVSPHQLHTPYTHHHYHHHQHVSPFSLHHQPPIHFPFSPPAAPPVYPTSIPPHLTTLNHTQSPPPVHTPSIPLHAEPPPVYVPLLPAPAPTPVPTQYGGKESLQFAPRLLTSAENALLVNSGSGSRGSSSSSAGGDRKGKRKAVDRGSSTASNSITGKKRKRESCEAGEEGDDVKRRTGKKQSREEDGGGEENTQKNPSSPTDSKKTGRKRNNKIDIACNHCRSRKLKCDGARPICFNCNKSDHKDCGFDLFPRRRGPAKHKQLKLDAESEPSWPLLRAVPRTRARVAAEAKILTQPLLVGAAGTSRRASTGGSEASFASGGAQPSTTSILFDGEATNREAFEAVVAAAASSAASNTRESTPEDKTEADANETEIDQAEGCQAHRETDEGESEEKKEEDAQKPKVGDEAREVKPKEENVKPKKENSPKEDKKSARLKIEGEEGKVEILKRDSPSSPSSPSSHHLRGRLMISYASTSTHMGYVGGPVATTTPTRHSPPAVAAAAVTTIAANGDLSHDGPAPEHEEEQGGMSDEEAESSDDDYDSQGEESE